MTVLRVALAQLASRQDPADNRARVLRAVRDAHARGARLVAFPELALSRFFPQFETFAAARGWAEPIPGPTTEAVSRVARELGIAVVLNLYESAGGLYYDSSPFIDADGTLLGVTRMVHITDYACFHERAYYAPGDRGAPVYQTQAGRVGVAICYDRHYPEYMRALGVAGAEVVVIPQAGGLDEWPEGMYEAEVRAASFQNGYFTALCNRVGEEDRLTFAGESFIADPLGRVVARGARLAEDMVVTDLNLALCAESPARQLFWRDRRPELYRDWLA
jgi:N-carbamoylputrescine amidase